MPYLVIFQYFLIAGFCASFHIKCFCKWRNFKCIIKDLINYIPSMPRYSWSKIFIGALKKKKKLRKKNITKFKDVIESYWPIGLMLVNSKELKV